MKKISLILIFISSLFASSVANLPAINVLEVVDCHGVNLHVNFATNSSKINHNSFANIKRFANYMIDNPSKKALIAGHTDSRGSDKSNLILSDARANAVMNKLISYGVSANRLSAKGYGETQPIASNATSNGRYQNRRIEAILR